MAELTLDRMLRQPGVPMRRRYLQRFEALKAERNSWESHWRELADYVLPREPRFLGTLYNRGEKRSHNIINNTATRALRTQSAGMMAGITSPARPWFRLTTPDPDLAEFGRVRSWLHTVEERMRPFMARSNIYKGLHQTYRDIALFGTAAMHVDEDADDVFRAYVFPVGSYALANSERLQVDTVYRNPGMTIGQLVERFGIDALRPETQDLYRNGQTEKWIEVLHVIEPNRDWQDGKLGPRGMRWRSCWMEKNGDDQTGLLKEGGFNEFPVMCPRWLTSGENVYGDSPGMDALGDIKATQLLERRKAQAADKIVRPPLRAPTSLINGRASTLPGDITYVDGVNPGQTIAPIHEINPTAVQLLGMEIKEHERRIESAFYADLWLLLSQSEGTMTAREVAERHEEKMLQLGPVLESLQDELLDPLTERLFSILNRKHLLPPPPEELQGEDIRVEYISVMAQAQRLMGTAAIERLATFTLGIAQAKPEALDKVNWDEVIDEYANAVGTKPDLVVPDDKVAALRKGREQAQAAMQQGQAMAQAATSAKDLAAAKLEDDSALKRLLPALGGIAGAVPAGEA